MVESVVGSNIGLYTVIDKGAGLPILKNRARAGGKRSWTSLPRTRTLYARGVTEHSPERVAYLPPSSSSEEVIDLGAPKIAKKKGLYCNYKPNPRLYPAGNQSPRRRTAPKAKNTSSGQRTISRSVRRRRQKHNVYFQPVPNSRLYRPAPPRPRPPPLQPTIGWAPPTAVKPLETASRAALRLSACRATRNGSSSSSRYTPKLRAPPAVRAPVARAPVARAPAARAYAARPPVARTFAAPSHANRARVPPSVTRAYTTSLSNKFPRKNIIPEQPELATPSPPAAPGAHGRLVVKVPAARLSLDTPPGSGVSSPAAALPRSGMRRHSVSPDDYSDANDTFSAPSEYLAEFLSAIMRRQYAEALKYCRLILQYEPNNATARGFFPLLSHKVRLRQEELGGSDGSSDAPPHSATSNGEACELPGVKPPPVDESWASSDSQWGADSGSGSSLSLDSLPHSSPRDNDHSPGLFQDYSPGTSCSERWEGSPTNASLSPRDHNGNVAAAGHDDIENDNAAGDHKSRLKKVALSLQQLRAQFTANAL